MNFNYREKKNIMKNKSVIVTGAAGFTGYSLTKELSDRGYTVYAVVRPGSDHNYRLAGMKNVRIIELDVGEIDRLLEYVDKSPFAMIHLVWEGQRYVSELQNVNINDTLRVLNTTHMLGCRRFICTGSQAEYGATQKTQMEDMIPNPFCAYGAAKVAACYLSRYRAKELGIDWIWGRIFSLYGIYEPPGRMLPDLVRMLKQNEPVKLSSCCQNWDYLHVKDAAEAIIALMEFGKSGEIYNIANGSYRKLKDYVEEAKEILGSDSELIYGEDPNPFVSLQPSVQKISDDTGWKPKISFSKGIITGF